MELYHITDKEYLPGQIVSINDFVGVSNYHQGLREGQKKINNYLSANCPDDEPSRQLCLYAFEKPEYCVFFRKNEIMKGQTMRLYNCEMNSPQGHPMILVHQFEFLSEDKWEKLGNEYWYPTQNWKLMEHLAEEMQIIEEIPISDALRCSSFMIGNIDYTDDYQKCKML